MNSKNRVINNGSVNQAQHVFDILMMQPPDHRQWPDPLRIVHHAMNPVPIRQFARSHPDRLQYALYLKWQLDAW